VKHLIRGFQLLFPSRLIFFLVSLTLILAIHNYPFLYYFQGGSWWLLLGRMDDGQMPLASGHWISQFFMHFSSFERLALTLVTLIAWLMPVERRQTLRRA